MASIFTRIVRGEIPCYKIAEDEQFLAFLDINPVAIGHTLVVPKKEVDYLFDLDQDLYAALMLFARKVALAINAAIECKRVGMLVVGTEVPHAHVHLIPFRHERQMDLGAPKMKLTPAEMTAVADRIAGYFS